MTDPSVSDRKGHRPMTGPGVTFRQPADPMTGPTSTFGPWSLTGVS